MGRTGNGRWTYYHNKKRTVEECWTINISEVARVVDLSKPGSISHPLRSIVSAPGKKMSPVHCVLEVGGADTPLLKLSYDVGGRRCLAHQVEEVVRLQTTQPTFGGVRWWFSCPRMVDDEECGRRLGKLYRPPVIDTSPAANAST